MVLHFCQSQTMFIKKNAISVKNVQNRTNIFRTDPSLLICSWKELGWKPHCSGCYLGELCDKEEYEDDDEQPGGPVCHLLPPGDQLTARLLHLLLRTGRQGQALKYEVIRTGAGSEIRM